ncbi:MAG: nitrous oxide reductase accessory protein NosL [Pseudomonadales bacterium]|nr:nitrous oxide reductase accessory protein NosL [Pseudomonadales bacterium]
MAVLTFWTPRQGRAAGSVPGASQAPLLPLSLPFSMTLPLSMTLLLALLLALGGCSKAPEEAAAPRQPVNFQSGDECHVCGMVIQSFPGPKGQAIGAGSQANGPSVKKFCSTRDLLAWKLQPEHRRQDDALFVHDMAQTEWAHPADTALIPAETAVFVVGSSRQGAMGPTLASFAEPAAARAFAERYGGEVLGYDQLTLDHLMPGHGHENDHQGMAHGANMGMAAEH